MKIEKVRKDNSILTDPHGVIRALYYYFAPPSLNDILTSHNLALLAAFLPPLLSAVEQHLDNMLHDKRTRKQSQQRILSNATPCLMMNALRKACFLIIYLSKVYCFRVAVDYKYWGVVRPSSTSFLLREKSNSSDNHSAQPPSEEEWRTLTANRAMSLLGTSPRRIVLSFASATTIALGTNFLGSTSALLSLIPEPIVEQSSLDLFYPRGPFKRVRGVEPNDYYSFLIPKSWVADTSLELAKAAKRTKALDYTRKPKRSASSLNVIPDVAFGPPGSGSTSRTNVSVVVSQVMPGFTLRGILGTPTDAANQLLQTSIAPQGSGRVATLLKANEEFRGISNVYQFEYWLDFETINRVGTTDDVNYPNLNRRLRAISVIAEREEDTLITLTVVAPESEWQNEERENRNVRNLRHIADSFKLYR